MQTIKDFIIPENADNYNPARTVTIAAGATETITLSGNGGKMYGFNRILPFAADMDAIIIKAKLNGERTIFQDVQLSVIREYFKNGRLRAPYVISPQNTLEFTLENTGAAEQTANIELTGYSAGELAALAEAYKAAGLKMPQPILMYGRKKQLTAGIANQVLDISVPSVDVEISRMAAASTNDAEVQLQLQISNRVIKSKVFIEQFNDEFGLGKPAANPLEVGGNAAFTVLADSLSAATETISFFAECYKAEE